MQISVRKISEGMKIIENVYSSLGGIVLKKGTVLKPVDIEILNAFRIEYVKIEDKQPAIERKVHQEQKEVKEKKQADDEIVNRDKNKDFYRHFDEALKIIDHTQKLAVGNAQLPIMALKKSIIPFIDESIHFYKYVPALNENRKNDFEYEKYHAVFVAIISHALAIWKGLDKGEAIQVALGGLLHDIGKARLPHEVLYKKGKLNNEEFDEVKRHTFYGYQLLKNTKGLGEGALLAILQHHEREDGSGYPLGLKKGSIHQYAKIVAIADVFHAMISKRDYRDEHSPFQALDEILTESFGKLDPRDVQLFITNITKSLIGEKVILNNGDTGTIVFVDQKYPTSPWVKIEENIINLAENKELFIKKLL